MGYYVPTIEDLWIKADRHFDMGKYSSSRRLLEEIIEDDPGFGRAHALLGLYYLRIVIDHDRAEVHLRYAVKFSPEFTYAWYWLICCLSEKHAHTDVIKIAKEGISIPNVDLAWIHYRRGEAFEKLGKLNKAIRAYKRAKLEVINDHDRDRFNKLIKRAKERRKKKHA